MKHRFKNSTSHYGKKRVHLLLFQMWLILSGGCLSQQTDSIDMTKGANMTLNDNTVFNEIETGILGPTPCSPQPPDPSFRGILINAPRVVTFKKGHVVPETRTFAKIPICGYYHINAIYPPPKYPSILEGMRMTAVNKDSQEMFTGPVIDCTDRELPPETTPFTKEELEGISVSAYFTPNLLEFVLLPEAPGVYEVYVELGEKGEDPYFRSNTVDIELMEIGKENPAPQ